MIWIFGGTRNAGHNDQWPNWMWISDNRADGSPSDESELCRPAIFYRSVTDSRYTGRYLDSQGAASQSF